MLKVEINKESIKENLKGSKGWPSTLQSSAHEKCSQASVVA